MSKILVTGGSGFIGGELVNSLVKKGHEVISFDILHNNKSSDFQQFNGSILNPYDLDKAVKNCDMIVHLAAMVGVELTEKKRLECLEINIQGTKFILDAAVKQKVKKVFFSSSSEVYGDQEIIPIKEDAQLKPKSNYGITKMVGEEYLKAYSNFYGFDYNIFRFFNLYGGNQRPEFMIPKFKKAIDNNEKLKIYGDGKQIRSYCNILDAIDGINRIIGNGKKNTTYNIGNNNDPISVIDLANKMVNLSKKNIKIEKISFEKSDRSAKREIYKRQPDISKIIQDLKYSPKINIDKGLKQLFSN